MAQRFFETSSIGGESAVRVVGPFLPARRIQIILYRHKTTESRYAPAPSANRGEPRRTATGDGSLRPRGSSRFGPGFFLNPGKAQVPSYSCSPMRGSVFQAGRVEVGLHSPTPTICRWLSACWADESA